MKSKFVLVFLLLMTSILSACNSPTISNNDDWEEHNFQDLGVAFELPANWTTSVNENLINITVNEDDLENGSQPTAGASITMATARDFDGFSDPQDILGLFIEFFEYGRDDLERTSEPQTTTIQGLPAATVRYIGTVRDQSGSFTVTVISENDNIALIFTFDSSETGEYAENFERFTKSVTVSSMD